MSPLMSTEDAVLPLRADPAHAHLVETSYLDADAVAASDRFRASEELAETLRLVIDRGALGRVLDLGAGTGIASRAFALAGAESIVAVEPDPSDVVGLGCLVSITEGLPVRSVAALGDGLPLASGHFDLVFCRQVLHHIPDLGPTLAECARLLRPGGVLLALREHVADEIPTGPSVLLERRFGAAGRVAGSLPGIRQVISSRLRRPRPGRLCRLLTAKPLTANRPDEGT